MKLLTLQALVAAIEEGSLRAAGKRLGISQPALTKMIRELEVELSTTLLVRSTTGVVATAQGMVMYERARAASREIAQAVEQIRQLDGHMTGALTVGAVPLAVMLLIPETLRTFSRDFPHIQLQIAEELYIAQLTRLRKGEVDIALGPLPPELSAGEFVVEELMPISMVAVVRKGNLLSKAQNLRELAHVPWVYTGGSADSGYAKTLFELHGMAAPPAGALVNSTLGLLSIVTSSTMVGLLPQQIASHPMATQFLETVHVKEGPLQLTLSALTRTDTHLKPSVRHFMAHLHRAAHQLRG